MGKRDDRKKIKRPDQPLRRDGLIPASAVGEAGEADKENPSFRFTHADDNKYHLSSWKAEEIKDLIRALKKFEKYTWLQIKSQGSKSPGGSVGCGFKIIQNHPILPNSISEDITLSEMRVCQTKRIFGFRVRAIYYVVWFDRNHEVCS